MDDKTVAASYGTVVVVKTSRVHWHVFHLLLWQHWRSFGCPLWVWWLHSDNMNTPITWNCKTEVDEVHSLTLYLYLDWTFPLNLHYQTCQRLYPRQVASYKSSRDYTSLTDFYFRLFFVLNSIFHFSIFTYSIRLPVTISLSDRPGHFFQSGFLPSPPVTIPRSHRPFFFQTHFRP